MKVEIGRCRVTGVPVLVDHASEDTTPLFDWRQQLGAADAIIEVVRAASKPPSRGNIGRIKQGTDLSCRRESVARLLAEVAECFVVARDDFAMRSDPKKPPRRVKILLNSGNDESIFDYCEFTISDAEWVKNWDTHWIETYAVPRGNPSTSRAGGPPLLPVYDVYKAVRDWWRAEGLGRFNPSREQGEGYEESDLNAPARFLLAVLRYLDASYRPENARSLHENLRRTKPRAKKRL